MHTLSLIQALDPAGRDAVNDVIQRATAKNPRHRYEDALAIATASLDGTARVWDTDTGRLLFTLQGSGAAVNEVLFSAGGKYLITSAFDGSLRSYVVETADLQTLAHSRLTRWWSPEECRQFLHQPDCPPAPEELLLGAILDERSDHRS